MPINSYYEMKEKKLQINRNLISAANSIDKLKEVGLSIEGKVLVDLQDRLKNDHFKVLVIGEFKNGKSTFINSILGDKILPAYSTPCTAVINEVKYGKTKKAILYFKNPLPDKMSSDITHFAKQHINKFKDEKIIPPITLNVDQLVDYVAIPDPTKDQADSIQELPYDKVILEYPNDLCKDGIEIIDSPGLNENGTRTKVTEEYLNQADALIFVFRCPKIASKTEMEYIENQILMRGYKDIFFVCNCINLVPKDERERLIRFGNKKLENITRMGRDGIFYVDALGALEAKKEDNLEKLSKTGIPQFEAALSEYLRNNRGKAKLMQVVIPCINFLDTLERQHICGYISSLNQDLDELEKKIKDAMPNLEMAKLHKSIIEQKIEVEMDNFTREVTNLMLFQYDKIISEISDFIDSMDLENHMTVNPFKQKEKKAALENEVTNKLVFFVEQKMGQWIKTELSNYTDAFIDNLESQIGENIDSFYDNLDEFRYEINGISKPKDISSFERIGATVIGTIVGGPTYGMVGASLGFGEIAKRSAITLGASTLVGVIAAFTPIGITTLVTMTSLAIIGSGILQIITGGKSLTEKYKKALKKSFLEKMEEEKESNSVNYAINFSKSIKSKFEIISDALQNEIEIEQSKIECLNEDKKNWEKIKEQKIEILNKISNSLNVIRNSLNKIKNEIE